MEPARTKSGSVSIGAETSKGGPTLAVALSFSALILTRTTLSAYDSTMTVVSSRYTIIDCAEIEGVVAKEAEGTRHHRCISNSNHSHLFRTQHWFVSRQL
jgi:hypothetical protein